MSKLITALTSVVPLVKKLLFPNGKFNMDRGALIIALLCILILGIEVFGLDTVISATDLLAPLVELLGSS